MNAKIYNGNVQPNPKEYKIWVNDEGAIKTWNGIGWVESSSSDGGGSSDSNEIIYYYKTKRRQEYNTKNNPAMIICGDGEALMASSSDGNITYPATFAFAALQYYGDGRFCVGFTFSNKITPVFINPDQAIYTYVKGSFEERIEQIIQIAAKINGVSYEEAKLFVYDMFGVDEFYENCTQITKEEYESLITNKPIE